MLKYLSMAGGYFALGRQQFGGLTVAVIEVSCVRQDRFLRARNGAGEKGEEQVVMWKRKRKRR